MRPENWFSILWIFVLYEYKCVAQTKILINIKYYCLE